MKLLVQAFCVLSLLVFSMSSLAIPVSKDALSVIYKVHVAAKNQDTATLKSLMVPEFIWSFGGDGNAEQAIQEWKTNKAYFKHLYTVTGKKCTLKPDQSVECPQSAGLSYRAGFRKTQEGWRMIYFVRGD
nr:hypothetical protein [uncultured Methylotenera sp.]